MSIKEQYKDLRWVWYGVYEDFDGQLWVNSEAAKKVAERDFPNRKILISPPYEGNRIENDNHFFPTQEELDNPPEWRDAHFTW